MRRKRHRRRGSSLISAISAGTESAAALYISQTGLLETKHGPPETKHSPRVAAGPGWNPIRSPRADPKFGRRGIQSPSWVQLQAGRSRHHSGRFLVGCRQRAPSCPGACCVRHQASRAGPPVCGPVSVRLTTGKELAVHRTTMYKGPHNLTYECKYVCMYCRTHTVCAVCHLNVQQPVTSCTKEHLWGVLGEFAL